MKSLTRKPAKDKTDSKTKKQAERKQSHVSDEAQCCAKISRTTAGCHD